VNDESKPTRNAASNAASDVPNSADDDMAHADIGFVAALNIEIDPFLRRCLTPKKYTGGEFTFRGGRYDDARVALVESGPGFAKARRATQALVQAHTPHYIVSCGFSGALQPELKLGHIVMADAICDTHGQHISLTLNLPEQLPAGVHTGRLVVVDEPVMTSQDKHDLGQTHHALAVDTGSLAVAQVCRDLGVGFLAVRVIIDPLDTDLHPEAQSVLAATTGRRIGATLGSLWKRPGSYKELWQLREQARFAAQQLASFLDGVVEQLYDAIPEDIPDD